MIAEDVAIRLTADSARLISGVNQANAALASLASASEKTKKSVERSWGDWVEKQGKALKRAGSDIAEAGAIFSGFGALMLSEASKYDRTVSKAVDELKNAYTGLAIEVGRTLVPVVKELSGAMSGAVGWFRSLSPEAKGMIVDFAKWTAGITAAGLALSGIGKVFEGLGNIIQLATSPLGVMLGTLLMIVAAIGAVKNASTGTEGGMSRLGRGITRAVGGIPLGVVPGLQGSVRDLFPKAIQEDLAQTEGFGGSLVGGFGTDVKKGFETLLPAGFIDNLKKVFADLTSTGGKLEETHKTLADQEKERAAQIQAEQKLRESIAEWEKDQAKKRKDFADAALEATRRQDDASKPFATAAPKAVPVRTLSAATKALDEFGNVAKFFGGALGEVTAAFVSGGLAGLLINLAQHSQGFADTVTILNGVLQAVANIVGAVLIPLQPLIASVMGLVEAIAAGVQPAFDAIASILEPFIPVIVALGEIFKALAPAAGIMLGAMQLFQTPMLLLVSKAMPLFFDAVKFIGLGLLKLTQFIAPVWNAAANAVINVWNGIILGLKGVFGELANFEVFGLKPFASLNTFFDGLMISAGSVTIDLNALAASIVTLEGLTWDSAMAKAKETAESLKHADAAGAASAKLRDLAEELTNVPQGFKVTAARYAAMAAGDYRGASSPTASPGAGGGIVPDLMGIPPAALPTLEAAASAAAPTSQVYVSVQLDSRELANSAAKVNANRAWQRTGGRNRMETF